MHEDHGDRCRVLGGDSSDEGLGFVAEFGNANEGAAVGEKGERGGAGAGGDDLVAGEDIGDGDGFKWGSGVAAVDAEDAMAVRGERGGWCLCARRLRGPKKRQAGGMWRERRA